MAEGPLLPSFWDASACAASLVGTATDLLAAGAAPEGEDEVDPPPPPAPPATPLEAAELLLEDESVAGAAAGSDAAADYEAICAALKIVPHPAVAKAIPGAASGHGLAIRGWQFDVGSMLALLLLLRAHGASMKSLRFWHCELDSSATGLLHKALPSTVEAAMIEPLMCWSPHVCEPGSIHIAPFAGSTSSSGTHAVTIVFGRIEGHSGASWCQPVDPP